MVNLGQYLKKNEKKNENLEKKGFEASIIFTFHATKKC